MLRRLRVLLGAVLPEVSDAGIDKLMGAGLQRWGQVLELDEAARAALCLHDTDALSLTTTLDPVRDRACQARAWQV